MGSAARSRGPAKRSRRSRTLLRGVPQVSLEELQDALAGVFRCGGVEAGVGEAGQRTEDQAQFAGTVVVHETVADAGVLFDIVRDVVLGECVAPRNVAREVEP